MSPRPAILALVGPTAAGKTAIALELAERAAIEVVSCDSLQVYRGLDVGTAKPTLAERGRVPHHLVDVVEPDEPFSAARFAALAGPAILAIEARRHRPLIVGGSGLYLRALRFGLVEVPAANAELREKLLAAEEVEPGVLHRRLSAVDPEAARRIAPRDRVRLVRALEVFELTGTPLSQHHAEHAMRAGSGTAVRVLFYDPPDEQLGRAIGERTTHMLAGGLVDETRALIARFGPELRPLGAVGYRQAALHVSGALTARALPGEIATATRGYARRQRTWFKKEPGALHLETRAAVFAAATAD